MASHKMIAQLVKLKLGNGSIIKPLPNKMVDPTPILTKVTVSGWMCACRLIPRPAMLDKEVAKMWIAAIK